MAQGLIDTRPVGPADRHRGARALLERIRGATRTRDRNSWRLDNIRPALSDQTPLAAVVEAGPGHGDQGR